MFDKGRDVSQHSAQDSNLDSMGIRRSPSGDTNEWASRWYNRRFNSVFVCPFHEIANGISSLLSLVVATCCEPSNDDRHRLVVRYSSGG